jgi:hypothetical protein
VGLPRARALLLGGRELKVRCNSALLRAKGSIEPAAHVRRRDAVTLLADPKLAEQEHGLIGVLIAGRGPHLSRRALRARRAHQAAQKGGATPAARARARRRRRARRGLRGALALGPLWRGRIARARRRRARDALRLSAGTSCVPSTRLHEPRPPDDALASSAEVRFLPDRLPRTCLRALRRLDERRRPPAPPPAPHRPVLELRRGLRLPADARADDCGVDPTAADALTLRTTSTSTQRTRAGAGGAPGEASGAVGRRTDGALARAARRDPLPSRPNSGRVLRGGAIRSPATRARRGR